MNAPGTAAKLPLDGTVVLDFGHTVMGPSCGMVLGDLGANVIKIEPAPDGDPTRRLQGFGAGYFGYFNRNKRSLAIDLKSEAGLRITKQLAAKADILIENFGPETMERLGLGYEALSVLNPRLVYGRLKGFLPGPYETRLALDEVVQMMGGLAYMTGPPGRPLRAGTSVVDIGGGLFAVIGILSALINREKSGKGGLVQTALFETTAFFMGQHLCCSAQSDKPVPPMPERVSAWAVYEIFNVRNDAQIFVGITADGQWKRFMTSSQRPDLRDDPRFETNNLRIAARPVLIPILQSLFASLSLSEAIELCERASIPFAPIARPEDLFDDPHLASTGGLVPTRLPNGIMTRLPLTPIRFENDGLPLRLHPPRIGEHSSDILRDLGLDDQTIAQLNVDRVVAVNPPSD